MPFGGRRIASNRFMRKSFTCLTYITEAIWSWKKSTKYLFVVTTFGAIDILSHFPVVSCSRRLTTKILRFLGSHWMKCACFPRCSTFYVSFWQSCGSGSARIRINFNCRIRIRERKMTHKYRKNKEFSCFEVLNVLFCGLKDSPVACSFFMEASGKVNVRN